MTLVAIEAVGDFGEGDSQREVLESVHKTIAKAGVSFEPHSHGVALAGDSNDHRWATVSIDGTPTDLKVLVGATQDQMLAELKAHVRAGFRKRGESGGGLVHDVQHVSRHAATTGRCGADTLPAL